MKVTQHKSVLALCRGLSHVVCCFFGIFHFFLHLPTRFSPSTFSSSHQGGRGSHDFGSGREQPRHRVGAGGSALRLQPQVQQAGQRRVPHALRPHLPKAVPAGPLEARDLGKSIPCHVFLSFCFYFSTSHANYWIHIFCLRRWRGTAQVSIFTQACRDYHFSDPFESFLSFHLRLVKTSRFVAPCWSLVGFDQSVWSVVLRNTVKDGELGH